jgi:hypothetical protein
MPTATKLARMYVGDWPQRTGVTLNTDEHPRLEFAMPLTYADQETLKQRRLAQYYDEVLVQLEQRGVEFRGLEGDYATPVGRRLWQREELRK